MVYILASQTIFDAATPEADRIRHLTNGFIIAASAMLLLVIALTAYMCIQYRARPGQPEPPQVHVNRQVEMWMVGIPLLMVIGFFFWSVRTMSAILPDSGSQPPDVIITGHQWWWEATYPGKNVTTANEIHVPAGKKLLLQLTSADVIHDWWVPALGGKMDMLPGKRTHLWLTIRQPGVYEGACSEFCGQQHAWMRIKVIAHTLPDYNRWLQQHAAPAAAPQSALAARGARIFMESTCSSCHRIKGTAANGMAGPDLTHFAARQTMLAGMLPNDTVHVYQFISDPQTVKPGAHMPRFIFEPDSLRALTAYLTQLK